MSLTPKNTFCSRTKTNSIIGQVNVFGQTTPLKKQMLGKIENHQSKYIPLSDFSLFVKEVTT